MIEKLKQLSDWLNVLEMMEIIHKDMSEKELEFLKLYRKSYWSTLNHYLKLREKYVLNQYLETYFDSKIKYPNYFKEEHQCEPNNNKQKYSK